jgi:hypothetical protein
MSLFDHYMVAASLFRVPPMPSQALFPWDVTKKCHSVDTSKSSLWHVICSNIFLIGLQTHQRTKQFFSVVIQICFQQTSLDAL